jgi:mono/diheme cytochrome c family protein
MNKIVSRGLSLAGCVAVLVSLTGCGKTSPPEFRLNMVAIAEAQLPEDQQQEIANILLAMFGTPDDPYVLPESGLDLRKLQTAAGPVRSDEFGRETGLYRRHCAHCHGTTGDGQGPTALVLNPYPRDYRQGKFKYKSTERAAKPTAHDMEMILRLGVQGTAMPSFDLLPSPQVDALSEYVKYLSIRGQVEIALVQAMADLGEGEKLDTSRALLVDEILKPIAESWSTASESIIQPADPPAADRSAEALAQSIEAGRTLFYGATANCVKCHGPSALGDGQATDQDDWNKQVLELTKRVSEQEASLADNSDLPAEERSKLKQQIAFNHAVLENDSLPPRNIQPRNLRQGIYRGGRRPLDLYRRIYAGINGAPMPETKQTLKPDQIWNLVDYVMSLPYEAISAPPHQRQLRVSQVSN